MGAGGSSGSGGKLFSKQSSAEFLPFLHDIIHTFTFDISFGFFFRIG